MNSLADLDHLDLDPAAKNQVAAVIQTLLDQARQDAARPQSKDAVIKANQNPLKYAGKHNYTFPPAKIFCS